MKSNLENKMNAAQIVHEAGMSPRPEFFSGRNATYRDLSSNILEKIHSIIQREHGAKAAKQYVKMVADIPELSATGFLLTLYSLERGEWKWDKKSMLENCGSAYIGGITDYERKISCRVTLLSAFSKGSQTIETKQLKREFLEKRGIKQPVEYIEMKNGVYAIF